MFQNLQHLSNPLELNFYKWDSSKEQQYDLNKFITKGNY